MPSDLDAQGGAYFPCDICVVQSSPYPSHVLAKRASNVRELHVLLLHLISLDA